MEGAVSLSFLLSMGSTLAAIVGAAAVARYQIRALQASLHDQERTLRALDKQMDALSTETTVQHNKISVLSELNSVAAKRRDAFELATLQSDVKHLAAEVASQHRMHNTVHPPVPNVRTAK